MIWIRIWSAVVFYQIQGNVISHNLPQKEHLLSNIHVKQGGSYWGGLLLHRVYHKLGKYCLKDYPAIYLPFSQQCSEYCVSNRHSYPGRLFQIQNWNEKLQHSFCLNILTVSHDKPILKVHQILEFSSDKLVGSVCKSFTFLFEVVSFSPLFDNPHFWLLTKSKVKLVWHSSDDLPHHLSSFTIQGLLIKRMHPMLVRFSSRCTHSPSSGGITGTTEQSIMSIRALAVGAILLYLLASELSKSLMLLPYLIRTTQHKFSLFSP